MYRIKCMNLFTLQKSDIFVILLSNDALHIMNEGYNFVSVILFLGFGATCGHNFLENIFRAILVQILTCFLLTILLLPLLTRILLRTLVITFLENFSNGRLSSNLYPLYTGHRRHAEVQSILTKIDIQPNLIKSKNRLKVITLISLLLLIGHSRFISLAKNRVHNLTNTNLTNYFSIPPDSWLFNNFLEVTDFSVILFTVFAIVINNGPDFRTHIQQKLFKLDFSFIETNACHNACPVNINIESNSITSDVSANPSQKQKCVDDSPVDPQNIQKDSSTDLDIDGCVELIKKGLGSELTNEQILSVLDGGRLKTRELESITCDPMRAVEIRRRDLAKLLTNTRLLEPIPYKDYDYRSVYGQCCEEVIGYVPLPVGKIGPLLLDGRSHYLPLATTEGCLVASTNRGCRALFLSGGVNSAIFRDQMSRAPVVWFPSVFEVVKCIAWIESDAGFNSIKSLFNNTSSHINLIGIHNSPAGHYLHIRFSAQTGNAMGMNMVSKATEKALQLLKSQFPNMKIISISGNMCTDKKPAAINTILGRGKSVLAEATLPEKVVAQTLHTTPDRLARLAHAKNWTGSAMAGCLGMMGSNAHAANIVAGLFAATGQDLAQVVESSACMTQFEVDSNNSLIVTVTMPCIEVGTIGGGTCLPAQRACLDLLNLSVDHPTEHLARLIAGLVLAGELSLMSALDTDDLVKSHMLLNRRSNISGISVTRTSVSKHPPISETSELPHPLM